MNLQEASNMKVVCRSVWTKMAKDEKNAIMCFSN